MPAASQPVSQPDDRSQAAPTPGVATPEVVTPDVLGWGDGSTVLTVSDPQDLVGLVPYRLGYRPKDSLVILCLRGERPRVGLILRVDLPAQEHLPALVDHLAEHAVRDGATAAVLVVYREGSVPETMASVVAEGLADRGVSLQDAWHVGGTRFRSLSCGDALCCPETGWPLESLDGTQISAEMVARGRVVASSREELAGDLDPVDDDRLERVGVLALEHLGRRPRSPAALRRWRRAALSTWRAEVGAEPEVAPEPAAELLSALNDPMVRDAVLLDCVPGGQEAADHLTGGRAGAVTERALDSVFGTRAAVAPDEVRLHRAEDVLRSLARQSDGTMRAAPLGLLAWSAWWSGDGARGSVLVDLTLAADDGHRLALLVRSALEGGLPPGWAQRDRLADHR